MCRYQPFGFKTDEIIKMSVVSIENGPHYIWGDNCDGWHLARSERLSVIQERVPPGSSEQRHLHSKSEQFFFVLAGIATLEVNGVIHTLNPNQGFQVPTGTPHTLSNQNEVDLEFLVISTPPSHGDRVSA